MKQKLKLNGKRRKKKNNFQNKFRLATLEEDKRLICSFKMAKKIKGKTKLNRPETTL